MSKCHRLGEAEKLRAVLETFLNKMMIYLVVRVFPITSTIEFQHINSYTYVERASQFSSA